MNEQLATYIKKNIMLVVSVCILGFLFLAAGQYYLYRQQMHLNKMVSEGFMQLKEEDENLQMQEQVNETETVNE